MQFLYVFFQDFSRSKLSFSRTVICESGYHGLSWSFISQRKIILILYIFYNFPVCFQDFFLFFYFPLPGIFQSWKFISSYSRFSRFSRVHGNPAIDFLQPRIKQKLRNIHNYAQKCVIGIDYVQPLCNRY